MSKKKSPLNSRTPQWFKDWHSSYFLPLQSRVSRNEKMIYIILAALLGSAALSRGCLESIQNLLTMVIGG